MFYPTFSATFEFKKSYINKRPISISVSRPISVIKPYEWHHHIKGEYHDQIPSDDPTSDFVPKFTK